jgi:hypothetical protein
MNIGSHPSNLSKYEKIAGLDSISYTYFNSDNHIENTNKIFRKDRGAILNELTALRFLVSETKNYDIIHYNFGSTVVPVKKPGDPFNKKYFSFIKNIYQSYMNFIGEKELQRLKKLGKRIFVTYQGGDARLASFEKINYKISPSWDKNYYNLTLKIEPELKKRINLFEKYADKIYSLNPDLLHTLPLNAEFLPYASVDLINDWGFIGIPNLETLKIVHAPTDKNIKGTKFILEAIEKLNSEGYIIEFQLVENLKREEARKCYEKADILIDQLLAGWYGGLGLELMSLGKPVICYIREEDLKFIPVKMKEELPVINANPNNIYEVLKKLITKDKYLLSDIGVKSRIYAEKWHNPFEIALRMKKDYRNSLLNTPISKN